MNVPFGGADILQPIELVELDNPIPGTPEYEAALQRDKSIHDITAMPWLPQLPDEWASSIYERIEAAERQYAAPNLHEDDYLDGSAEAPNDIAIVRTDTAERHLLTAEHATKAFSLKTHKHRVPDAGTGGLTAVIAEDYGTGLIMRGKQTSNVPSDPDHPIRPFIERELATADSFISVHGKFPNMFVHLNDRCETHVSIGLGDNPPDALMELAKKLVLRLRDDWGLYGVIANNQPSYVQQPGDTVLRRHEDGTVKRSQLAGLGSYKTVHTSRDYLKSIGRDRPTFQLEITRLLRMAPDNVSNTDKKSLVMGVALGYRLVETVVKLVPEYESQTQD